VVGFGKRVIGADGHQGSFHNFGEDIFGKGGPNGRMGAFGAAQTFFNHIGNSLGDGVVGVYDHATGDTDHEKAVLDDAKTEDATTRTMLKGSLGGDDGLIATAGQAAADKIYAREYPAAAGELDKDAAGQMAKAKAGVIDQAYNDPFGDLAMVAPVGAAGRLAALGRLGKMMEAAQAAGDGTRAARIGKAMEALRGGKAGAALREAQEAASRKLSAKGQAIRERVRAAVTRQQERMRGLSGASGPGGLKSSLMIGKPYTARSLAASQELGRGAKGLHILNEKQLALHHRLVKSTAAGGIVLKTGEVSFKDVAKLTEATNNEHAVVRLRNGSRMLIKGDESSIKHIHRIPVKRLIVHSHPGENAYALMPSGKKGDLDYLWSIGQRRSYIVTSETGMPGTDYWLGSFDNQGYWRALNTPPMMPVAGQLDYVKGPQARR